MTTVADYQPCKVPLRRVKAFGVEIVVHEGIVADVFEAERRWNALGGASWFPIRQSDTGAYNCRHIGNDPDRPWSPHSWGVAIDFNWQSNPYGPKRNPCPAQPQMREFYEKCWRPLGNGWGGAWNSVCDSMHISKKPSDGGTGKLYQTWTTEEDDVTNEDHAKIAAAIKSAVAPLEARIGALEEAIEVTRASVQVSLRKKGGTKGQVIGIDQLVLQDYLDEPHTWERVP